MITPTYATYQCEADRVEADPDSTTGFKDLDFKLGRGENSRTYPKHKTIPICLNCHLPSCFSDDDWRELWKAEGVAEPGKAHCPIYLKLQYEVDNPRTVEITVRASESGLNAQGRIDLALSMFRS